MKEQDDLIDYYQLLVKYMAYVGDQEGVDFIKGEPRDERFSEEEWVALEQAASDGK